MQKDIKEYNLKQAKPDKEICELLMDLINKNLKTAEGKIWHGHPVWFINGNPIVGYSKEKKGVRLMFWSGVDFGESELIPGTGKFKDASIFYNDASEINKTNIKRWLKKSEEIQWDYKNVVKRKGKLVRLT